MTKNNKFSKQHLATNMTLLTMLVDQIESKLDKAIELFEKIGDVSEKNKAMQMSHLNEFISALNFLQSVLDWLFSYESKALQPYNSAIARLVSLVSGKFNLGQKASLIRLLVPSCASRTRSLRTTRPARSSSSFFAFFWPSRAKITSCPTC